MNNPRKRRWSLLVAVLLLVVLGLIAIPRFVPARFTSSGAPLSVRVRVADADGVPIDGATVQIAKGWKSEITGNDGECEIVVHFPAHGVVGRSGVMQLGGVLLVEAPGYQPWEKSFDSLLGPEYDYFNHGTTVTQKVILMK